MTMADTNNNHSTLEGILKKHANKQGKKQFMQTKISIYRNRIWTLGSLENFTSITLDPRYGQILQRTIQVQKLPDPRRLGEK